MRGVQLGLVNVADDIEGVPIGLVNVRRSGGVRVLAWGGYTSHANVGLKFATRYTYSMLTFGYRREDEVNAFGPGFVFGVHVPVAHDLGVAFDVGGDYLFGARLCCYESRTAERIAHTKDRNHYRLRILPTWQVRPRFALFAGGGVSANVPFALYSDFRGYDRTGARPVSRRGSSSELTAGEISALGAVASPELRSSSFLEGSHAARRTLRELPSSHLPSRVAVRLLATQRAADLVHDVFVFLARAAGRFRGDARSKAFWSSSPPTCAPPLRGRASARGFCDSRGAGSVATAA